MEKNKPIALVSALLLIFCGQVFFSARTKAPTADELAHHVASGYSYLVTGDFRMNPAAPPLPRLLSAIPLYFLGAKAPLDHWSWEKGDSPEFARQFFFHYNHRPDEFTFWSRVPIVLLSVIFGLSVFLFSRRLFGDAAALSSLTLYCFSPNILAHSGLATADLMVAFFYFLSCVAFAGYLRVPSAGRASSTVGAVTMTTRLTPVTAAATPRTRSHLRRWRKRP